ncbi:hypothetical protein [Carboxylicivirga marina]|uniref:Uncharacterized protein n=1 Tax=Carboxylicivirga marina TaxID=2800988 RepID=A0ABS1HGC8_9BACT|nr:hypothetical protein [Carboxylicivirga marina]MBK3516622.1 hypothetical protein [Carboxylicivirga marina]
MKKTFTLFCLLTFGLFAHAQTNAETLQEFLGDVISFEDVKLDPNRPMTKIRQLASVQADTLYVLTPANANEVFKTATVYQHCIVFTGSHTIARVTDFEKTLASGSWKTKMPYAEGFIQRGDMSKKNDYLNNIIGMPSDQKRVVFLFR